MIMAAGTGLRDGYAEVGDQRLHYVEAGEGPLIVLLHGFPEFWYGWRPQIQPPAAAGFRVVAPDMRGYNLSSKPDGVAAYNTDRLVADIRGLIKERLRPPGAARERRARQPLALLPALPARRPPALHDRRDRALCRGVVAAGRSNRDDQLLPILGAAVAKEGRRGASPDQCPHPG